MKKSLSFVLLLTFAFCFVSCSFNTVEYLNEEAYDFDSIGLVDQGCYLCKKGKGVSLKMEVSGDEDSYLYQWFKCSSPDKENAEKIEGAVNNTFYTGPIAEKNKVYYFYCDVTKKGLFDVTRSSSTFYVADTGLPTVYINTPAFINDTSTWVKDCTITIDDKTYSNASVKGRGNTSWDMPKKSYSIKFKSKEDLLGMGNDKKWVLIANYSDKTLLRNYLASYLGNYLFNNNWEPEFRFVDVVLNDEYLGTYLLGEQIKIGSNRLKMDDISDKFNDSEDLDEGGFIFACDKHDETEIEFITTRGRTFVLKDPDPDNFDGYETTLPENVYDFMLGVIQEAEDVIYSEDFKSPEFGYESVIDVDSFVDFYIVNELTKNVDANWSCSVYFYYNPIDKKIYMGPNWDFDISCGNINYNGCDATSGFHIRNSGWHQRLFEDPAFCEAVKERWNEKKEDLCNVINSFIQETADDIKVSAELNFVKWPILGKYVWPNASGFWKRRTYQSELDYLIEWLNKRYTWIDSQ